MSKRPARSLDAEIKQLHQTHSDENTRQQHANKQHASQPATKKHQASPPPTLPIRLNPNDHTYTDHTLNLTSIYRYNKLEKLGEGNYGAVYKALDSADQEIVALKKIKLDDSDEGCPSTALREASLLQELRHPNIIGLKDIIYSHTVDTGDDNASAETDCFYLVFEHADSDLRRFLDAVVNEGKSQCPMQLVQYIMYQMFDGLAYMHEKRFLHRDLKPQNILIDCLVAGCKIGDLGLARQYHMPLMKYTHEVATLWYRAPEILMGTETYTTPADIWSIGCIMAEVLTGIPLFTGDSEIGQLFLIFQTTGTPNPATNWPGCIELPDWHPTFPQWRKKPVLDRLKLLVEEKLQYVKEQIAAQGGEAIVAAQLDLDDTDAAAHSSTPLTDRLHKPWSAMIYPELALDLIERCLVLDPAHRIHAKQALQHPFFHNMDIKAAEKQARNYESHLAARMLKRKKQQKDN